MLDTVAVDLRDDAEFGLRPRLASSRYTPVQLREARKAARTAFQIDPRLATNDGYVRHVSTGSWLPLGFLERRRTARSE